MKDPTEMQPIREQIFAISDKLKPLRKEYALCKDIYDRSDDTELTPAIINRLIQRIEVHKSEKIDGRKQVRLDVYFTAVGLIDIPSENELIEMMQEIQSA